MICESLGRYVQNGLKPSSSTVGSENVAKKTVHTILGMPLCTYPSLKMNKSQLKMDGTGNTMFGFPNWGHPSLSPPVFPEGGACMSCGNHP